MINRHKFIANKGINIYSTPNLGPYRKMMPIILQLNKCLGYPNTPIITIDDDVIYPNYIIGKITNELIYSNSVVAHRGRKLIKNNNRIGLYKESSVPSNGKSFSHLGNGKNGIGYRLKYFPKKSEEMIGPIIAPTADDIWSKWITSSKGIPTIILEPEAAYDSKLDFEESYNNDKRSLFNSYNKHGIND